MRVLIMVVATGMIGAGLWLSGCSSEGKPAKESAKAVEGLNTMRTRVVSAQKQLNETVEAMNALSGGGDLKSNYRRFTNSLKETESQAELARRRREEMQKRSSQYIAQWEKEMEQVSSPELRAGAEERRQRVRNNFEQISREAQDVRQAYEPLIQNLRDIDKTLKLDLTPAGVQAARPAMDRANADAKALNRQLDEFIAEMDRVIGTMGTK